MGMAKSTTDVKGLADAFGVSKKSVIQYISGIKDGTIVVEKGQTALQGYQAHLKSTSGALLLADIRTKALSASMKVLSTAGWMAIFAIGSAAIGKVVELADDVINKVQKTKERVDDLMSSYQSAIETANNNAKTTEGLVTDYERLSKGINSLGQNVSLTTDEYSKYNDIVNQIADMFPDLITGYDSQGNAILSLKGNVELLRDAYKEAQQEAYNLLITSGQDSNGNDIIADFKNKTRDENFIERASSFFGNTSTSNAIAALQKLLNATTGSVDNFKTLYDELYKLYGDDFDKIGNAIDTSKWGEWTEKDLQDMASTIKSHIQTLQTELNASLSNVQTLANAYLLTNNDYEKLDEQSKNAASIIINSLNENLASGFDSKEDVGAYVQDILSTINSNPDVREAMIGLFTLDYSDMPIEKSVEVINQYVDYIANILGENPLDLKIRLGFNDFNDLETQYQNAIASAQEKFGKDETDFFSQNSINTKEEVDIWLKIAQKANSAAEAEKLYLEQLEKSKEVSKSFVSEFENLPIDKIEEYVSLVRSGNIDDGTIASFSELKTLMSDTGMNAKDAAKALKDYADGYTLSTDLTSNIQNAYDLLKSVGEQYKKTGKIGLSSLESIAKQYPQLRAAVNEYTQGLISADDMISQLQTAYDNDAIAYKAAMAYKLSGDEEFFSTIVSNNKSLFDDLGKAYGLDVENWKTMAQAKVEIDQKLIQSLSTAWSKYYNIVFDSVSGLASIEGGIDYSHVGSRGLGATENEKQLKQQRAWSEATKQANKYNQIINKLNESASIQIEPPDFRGIGSVDKSGSGSKKTKEETKKEIDWIERELKLLNDERSKLMDKASDSTIDYLGITNDEFSRAKELFNSNVSPMSSELDELFSIAKKAGLSISELYSLIANGNPGESRENYLSQALELDKTILPQTEQAVESYKKIWEGAASKISAENKTKIELGYKDVETLSGDELKNVESAMDAFDKYQSMQDNYAEAQKKNTATIIAQYDNRIASINKENEQLEKSNSILEARIDYLKSMGEIPSASLYEKLIQNTGTEISNTKKEISAMEAKLRGAFTKYGKNSEEYADLEGKIREAEKGLYGMKKAQEGYNDKLKQIPIDNLSTVISMYKDINDLMSSWGAEIEASGEKLNSNYYQAMISNGSTIIDQYKEQASLIEDLMGGYKTGSDKWNELYGQLQNVNLEMSSMVQNLHKWNEELLKMPFEKISSYTSELQMVVDGLSGVKSDYDTTISAVTGAIKEQIDAINEQKDAVNKEYDAQKKALQDKLDLLNKQNKELQLQQKYEQALYDLQKANQQATEKVIRDGQVVYEQNADKLRQAQEAVQDAKFDMETNKIQTQIDDLQETLDGLNEKYQDQIDSLQKISDKWSEISEKITQAQNEAKADELLGIGWKDKVLSGKDLELFNNFSGMYANTAEQLKKYQDQINTTNNIYSLLEDYITSYKEGTLSYDQALNGINDLLSQMNKTMSSDGNLQNIYDYLGAMNGTAANAENVLAGIQQGLSNSATELLESFKQYNQNAGMISEYTSSWQQLTNNVSSMLDVLKEVRDNLEDAYDSSDNSSDDDGAPFRKGSSGYVNSGPGVKVEAYKKGIENGLVGTSSTSDREAKMKMIGLKDLERDEVLALLHKNEAVFNPEQQNTLLSNLSRAWSYTPSKIPDYSNMLANRSNVTTQEFKFGNINIQECDDTNGLAQGILNGGLKSAFIQQSGKR